MPILTMPGITGKAQVLVRMVSNTMTHTSPLNNVRRTTELPGAAWHFTFTLPRMDKDKAAEWSAFFMQLRGMAGRFYGGSVLWSQPRGVGGGVPRVNGSSQTGTSLAVDGLPANTAGWLKVGDHFSVGDELKVLTADANSNAGGQAVLAFEPPLRNSPADNATLTIDNPTCVLALTSDSVGWDEQNAVQFGFVFSAMEAIF